MMASVGSRMWLRILLAAALLGCPATLFPRPAGIPSSAGSGLPAATGKREVWWNGEWARIIELSGSWEVLSEGSVTFLRPEDPACRLSILARGTGVAMEYEMAPEGEVALAFGWIMVSSARPTLLGDRPADAGVGRPKVGTTQTFNRVALRAIEQIAWNAGADWQVSDFGGTGKRFSIWSAAGPREGETGFELRLVSGRTVSFPAEGHVACFLNQRRSLSGEPRRDTLDVGGRLP